MKLSYRSTSRRKIEAAFTMVEIAICMAVIGFALVAIIGVLPMGMNVQKENREETIINQDAAVFMEAIRNGARGLDDLTNYVTVITNSYAVFTVNTNSNPATTNVFQNTVNNYFTFTDSSLGNAFRLAGGSNIIGLLSTPKYEYIYNGGGELVRMRSNFIVAEIRALSGTAVEKVPQTNADMLAVGFRYRLVPELSPVASYDMVSQPGRNLQTNLHELRLAFRWPLLPSGIGNGRQVFRTFAAGTFTTTTLFSGGNSNNYFYLQPSSFVSVPQ